MKIRIQDIIKKEKNISEGEDNEEIIKKLLNESHKTINKNEICLMYMKKMISLAINLY